MDLPICRDDSTGKFVDRIRLTTDAISLESAQGTVSFTNAGISGKME